MIINYQATKELIHCGTEGATIANYEGNMGCDSITELNIPLTNGACIKYTHQDYNTSVGLENNCSILIEAPINSDENVKFQLQKGANCIICCDPKVGLNTVVEGMRKFIALMDENPNLANPT